jgi:hypothetical protein
MFSGQIREFFAMASILNGSRMIQGDPGTKAPEYGRSAYRNTNAAEQDTLQQLREQKDLNSVLQTLRTAATSVRYTPEDTVDNGHLRKEGLQNLLGFADEFIETHDKNGDGALGHEDFYEKIGPLAQMDIERLDYELANPQLPEQDRKDLEADKKRLLESLDDKTAQMVEFMDLPDSEGNTDGLVTRDEAAAFFLTQDGTLEALKKNYGHIKKEFEAKYPDESWTWFQLKWGAGIAITQLFNKLLGKEKPFQQDGRISGPESFVSWYSSILLPDSSRDATIQNYRQYDLGQYKPKSQG